MVQRHQGTKPTCKTGRAAERMITRPGRRRISYNRSIFFRTISEALYETTIRATQDNSKKAVIYFLHKVCLQSRRDSCPGVGSFPLRSPVQPQAKSIIHTFLPVQLSAGPMLICLSMMLTSAMSRMVNRIRNMKNVVCTVPVVKLDRATVTGSRS